MRIFHMAIIRRPFWRHLRAAMLAGVAMLAAVAEEVRGAESSATPATSSQMARFREAVGWLAAPEREGRGPGTTGIDQAADWVAGQLAGLGLETHVGDAESVQPFVMTLEATLGPDDQNRLELVGPADGRAVDHDRLGRRAVDHDLAGPYVLDDDHVGQRRLRADGSSQAGPNQHRDRRRRERSPGSLPRIRHR